MFARKMNEFAKLFGQGINFPSEHEARWITDSVKHSPDLGWLEQHEHQLLFCADDTRPGYSHNCLISEHEFVATAFTAYKFRYWYQQAGEDRIPVPMMEQPGETHLVRYFPPLLKVRGELLRVKSYQFRELDNYKANRVQFLRKRVNVFVPSRELRYARNTLAADEPCAFRPLPRALQGTLHPILSAQRMTIVRCWMYVGRPEFWNDLFDAGFRGFKIVNHYESKQPWLKEYYDFPKKPLED